MAEKRQRINVNIYRASHNAEESQYIFDVEEELKKLPKSPGVYIMHSKNDDILYVGKAVSLHSRCGSIFRPDMDTEDLQRLPKWCRRSRILNIS